MRAPTQLQISPFLYILEGVFKNKLIVLRIDEVWTVVNGEGVKIYQHTALTNALEWSMYVLTTTID